MNASSTLFNEEEILLFTLHMFFNYVMIRSIAILNLPIYNYYCCDSHLLCIVKIPARAVYINFNVFCLNPS